MAPVSKIAATIANMRACQAVRAAGRPVYLTTDPAWMLDMAINRRAGWAEDPHARHTVNAKVMPRFATGDAQRHLAQIAHEINTPRLIVRERRLGEWRTYMMKRIPDRIHVNGRND